MSVKVGDIVAHRLPLGRPHRKVVIDPCDQEKGVVVEIMPSSHAKQWQKAKVLTEKGLEEWIVQFCEVINESR